MDVDELRSRIAELPGDLPVWIADEQEGTGYPAVTVEIGNAEGERVLWVSSGDA